jgi:hypothetical protein
MMKIAKIYMKKKKVTDMPSQPIFVEVVKVGSVTFDPRPNWVFVREIDKASYWKNDVFWVHPEDNHFDWVREFA